MSAKAAGKLAVPARDGEQCLNVALGIMPGAACEGPPPGSCYSIKGEVLEFGVPGDAESCERTLIPGSEAYQRRELASRERSRRLKSAVIAFGTVDAALARRFDPEVVARSL